MELLCEMTKKEILQTVSNVSPPVVHVQCLVSISKFDAQTAKCEVNKVLFNTEVILCRCVLYSCSEDIAFQ